MGRGERRKLVQEAKIILVAEAKNAARERREEGSRQKTTAKAQKAAVGQHDISVGSA